MAYGESPMAESPKVGIVGMDLVVTFIEQATFSDMNQSGLGRERSRFGRYGYL